MNKNGGIFRQAISLLGVAMLIFLAATLLVACGNEDTEPAGLSRAEVVEIVRAEASPAPVPSEPGLSRSEVEEIARAVVMSQAEPGLSRSEVEEIAQAAVTAMPQPEAEPGLSRSEVEEIVREAVRAAMAEAAEPASASCRLVQGEPGQPGEAQLHVEVIAEDLEIPWGLAILPNGDMLVTERPGRVRLIQNGEVVPEPVLEFGVSILPPLFGNPLAGSEGGLLGVLLHPEFAANRQFYLFYNIDNEEGVQIGQIGRYVLSGDGRSATFDRVILDDLPAGLHHQGGRMRIGPDGMLYVGIGAYDPPEAQSPDTLAGKLLRMDLDGGIPADNPDPDSYIFVSGIRNTQGYDWFDDQHIVMVDHGPSGFELGMPDLVGFDEVNVVTAGDNLGWPRVWGCDTHEGLVSPVLAWEGSVPPTGATPLSGRPHPGVDRQFPVHHRRAQREIHRQTNARPAPASRGIRRGRPVHHRVSRGVPAEYLRTPAHHRGRRRRVSLRDDQQLRQPRRVSARRRRDPANRSRAIASASVRSPTSGQELTVDGSRS